MEENKSYVLYFRVSTRGQGVSGLGLDAQRTICEQFVEKSGGKVCDTFTDIESGTHRDRPGLLQALEYCKNNGCELVIAKLDRLARDVEFVFKIVNSGVPIHFCDMPVVNTMILGVFASVAQYERELISQRTKNALEEAKKQGRKIGRPKGIKTTEATRKSAETRRRRAMDNPSNKAIWGVLRECTGGFKAVKSENVGRAARLLTEMGVKTSTGMDITPKRVITAYHNLKHIYSHEQA